MERDEYEMLIEYSEMTAFNFDSKEYNEVRKDFLECKETVNGVQGFFEGLVRYFTALTAL